jgi:hypothetical protein
MSSEKKTIRFKPITIIAAAIVAVWICVTIVFLGAFNVHQIWPAALVLLFMFEAGGDPKGLKNIFAGGIVGLLLAAALPPLVGFIAPSLGLQPAILLMVGLFVFLIIALGDISHMLFNNYAFAYFTIALIFHKQLTVEWLATLVLGGIFFVGGFLGILNLIMKITGKTLEELS